MSEAKKNAVCAVIIAAVATVSCAFVIVGHFNKAQCRTAYVYSDGVLVETIDLDSVTQPYTFTVEHEGEQNTIEVRNGEIGVVSATCPDKICVNRGFVSSTELPVVCLPNKLVIEISSSSGIDAITQ